LSRVKFIKRKEPLIQGKWFTVYTNFYRKWNQGYLKIKKGN